jgi:hypothetical protein
MPAHAGIQESQTPTLRMQSWMPAFAGMTGGGSI